MKKNFKPEVKKDIVFVTSKRDGGKMSSKNAINEIFKSVGGIKKAKTYLSNAWTKFTDAYKIEDGKCEVIFKEFLSIGKEKMKEGGFADGIDSAVKNATNIFTSQSASVSPTENTTTEGSENGTTSTDSSSTETAATPTEEDAAGSETAGKDGNTEDTDDSSNGKPKKPSETESDEEGTSTDDSETDEEDKDSENESKTTTKKKFPWFTAIISCLCGMLVAVIAIMLLGGQFSGPANRTSPDTNADSVTYEAYEFLMLDSSKSYIKLSRNNDVALKHACRLITSPTVVTAKDGKNYLKYSHTTDDFVIEIIAPVFEDHPDRSSTRLTMEESIADRNQKFGAVEVMWNGDLAVVTLLYNGESITLNVVE